MFRSSSAVLLNVLLLSATFAFPTGGWGDAPSTSSAPPSTGSDFWGAVTVSAESAWGAVAAPFGDDGFVVQQSKQLWANVIAMLQEYILPLSNIVYVGLMLYGFARLPANFMLVLGLLTLFIGPLIAGWAMRILAAGFSTAAYAPVVIIVTAWMVVFLKSALFQTFALALGLDQDRDGDVDGMDVLHWFASTRCGQWLYLADVHRVLVKIPSTSLSDQHGATSIREAIERLQRIEALLANGSAPADAKRRSVQGLPQSAPLPAPRPSKSATSDGEDGADRGSSGPTLSLPKWASPAGAEEFAAKQRAKLNKLVGGGADLL